MRRLAGSVWSPGRDPSAYHEVDARPFEHGGVGTTFPHVLPTDVARATVEIETHTTMDSLTLDAAFHGIRADRLGQRTGVDLLAISLSATDNIGHRHGPGSLEVHDHLLNVDRWLGAFFDSVATRVPLDRVIISLTSDHGVTDFPRRAWWPRLDQRRSGH